MPASLVGRGKLIKVLRVRFCLADDLFAAQLNGAFGDFDAALQFLNFLQGLAVLGLQRALDQCVPQAAP